MKLETAPSLSTEGATGVAKDGRRSSRASQKDSQRTNSMEKPLEVIEETGRSSITAMGENQRRAEKGKGRKGKWQEEG